MKKLKRSNLDELAENLPILNDKETQECIGGEYFFDYDGNFLGQIGSEKDLMVTTPLNYQNNRYNLTLLASMSTKPSEADMWPSGMSNLVSHFARPLMGVNAENIIVYSGIFIDNQFNDTHPALFNGQTLFINDWGWGARGKMPVDNYDDLNNTFQYALDSGCGYIPGRSLTRAPSQYI